MACEHYYELISAQLDRELTREEEQELNAHLEQCPSCRALAEQLAGLHEDFSALEDVPAPEGFTQGVMERIREEKKVIPLFKRSQFKAVAGLAACLAICVGLYGAGQLPFTNEAEKGQLQKAAEGSSASYDNSGEYESGSDHLTEFYTSSNGETEDTEEAPLSDPGAAEQETQPASVDALPRVNTAKYGANVQQFTSDGPSNKTQSGAEGTEDQPPAAEPETPVEEPTVEGADNQNGLADGEEPGDGVCLFDHEQVIKVTCDTVPETPTAVILGSTQSLKEFVGVFAKNDLSAAVKSYDEVFFQNGRLLAAVAATDSSGQFQLMEDGLTKEQVTLTEQRSETDAGEQSVWLILAEVGTEFSDGDVLSVVIEPQ